jgi:hypothetical protein
MQQLPSKVIFNITIEEPFTPIGCLKIFLGLELKGEGTNLSWSFCNESALIPFAFST